MLSELTAAGDQIGFRVWEVFQIAATWIAATAGVRPSLFHDDDLESLTYQINEEQSVAELPSCALVTILAEISAPRPQEPAIAFACLAVAEWATGAGHPETALSYFSLAAGVADDSRHAWTAGAMFRARGRVRPARSWFRVAHAAATREGDWNTKVRALLSYAGMALHFGRYQDAHRKLANALRVSQRKHLTELRAEVHHDLFVVGAATGDHALAHAHADEASRRYGPKHPRLSRFAHDLAVYWIERGDYGHALTVLLPLVENHFQEEPQLLLLALASATRAAAGARERATFDTLRSQFDELRGQAPVEWPQLAPALLHVARGAIHLGELSFAKQCLTESMAAGAHTEQQDVVSSAETLLRDIGSYA